MTPILLTAVLLLGAGIVLRFAPDLINRARYQMLVRQAARWTEPDQSMARDGLILMPVCGRPEYLAQVLDGLARSEGVKRHCVVFSQDGNNPDVADLIGKWQASHPLSLHMRHARPYFALPNIFRVFGLRHEYLISANIYSLLFFGFESVGARWAIVLEDDLVPSSDFLAFFRAAREQLLTGPNADERILAVSGWSNWNFSRPVSDAEKHSELLHEIKLTGFNTWAWAIDRSRWPLARTAWRTYFIAWDSCFQRLRERTGLYCATPVISRVLNIGMQGVNFREDPANPGMRWQTQSILTDQSEVRFDPSRRFVLDIFPPSQVTFIDGASAQ